MISGYKSALEPRTVRVPITFRPAAIGRWQGTVVINFADSGTLPVRITLTANVTEVPIFLESKTVDFGTVLYDHVYRDCLVVHNRGKTALKCELELPEHALQPRVASFAVLQALRNCRQRPLCSSHGGFHFLVRPGCFRYCLRSVQSLLQTSRGSFARRDAASQRRQAPNDFQRDVEVAVRPRL